MVDGGSRDGTAGARPAARRPRDRGAARPRRADERRRRRGRRATCCCSCTPTRRCRPTPTAWCSTASPTPAWQWGRFDVRIEGRNPLLPMVAGLMNWRSQITGIATGDQAMFVTRDGLRRGRRLSRHPADGGHRAVEAAQARRPAAVPRRPRRAPRGGAGPSTASIRTIVLMWRLRLAYCLGAEPAALARRYGYAPRDGMKPVRLIAGRSAKAPRAPGFAKTRLIPALGAEGAAALAARLIERAVATACARRHRPGDAVVRAGRIASVVPSDCARNRRRARPPAGRRSRRAHARSCRRRRRRRPRHRHRLPGADRRSSARRGRGAARTTTPSSSRPRTAAMC